MAREIRGVGILSLYSLEKDYLYLPREEQMLKKSGSLKGGAHFLLGLAKSTLNVQLRVGCIRIITQDSICKFLKMSSLCPSTRVGSNLCIKIHCVYIVISSQQQ